MRRFFRDQGLSIAFLVIFVLALVGQSLAGHAYNNEELQLHNLPPIGYGEFVTSSEFLVDVAENWQSEFLQFFLFIRSEEQKSELQSLMSISYAAFCFNTKI